MSQARLFGPIDNNVGFQANGARASMTDIGAQC
jgi:hypothetical protein